MTNHPLASRGAVVTGAGRGIGEAVARALAGAGATLLLASRTPAEVEAVATSIRAAGGRAWSAVCDVTDEAAVRRLGEEATRRLGDVDIVVNNAGDAESSPLATTTLAAWNRLLAVNATGTFLVTREFAPAMAARGRGRVVNIASTAGLEGGKYIAPYAAAKHAVVGFTKSIALELADRGVTVNAVCPGYVDTPLTDRSIANVQARTGLDAAGALAAILASGGQARLVQPAEVAAEVLRLCLDEAAGLTGRSIRIPALDAAGGGTTTR